ncbi:MAG: restriction endonuclease [Bacteroidia bacterium]
MKQGRLFETLVRLMREALNEQAGVLVKQNERLRDLTGELREFDVVLETMVNEFPARVVFECKDTRSPVTVGKMEAFIAKIQSIPGVGGGVYVSRSGFQRQAQKKARAAGITLISMRVVDQEKVSGMLAVLRMRLRQLDFELQRVWFHSKGVAYIVNADRLLYEDGKFGAWDIRRFFANQLFPGIMRRHPDLPSLIEHELAIQGEDTPTTISIDKIGPGLYFYEEERKCYCSKIEFELRHRQLVRSIDPNSVWEYGKWNSTSADAKAFEYDPEGLGFKIVVVDRENGLQRVFLLDQEWREVCPDLPALLCGRELVVRLPGRLLGV